MKFTDLWSKLAKSKEYRSAFARQQFKRLIPFQISALRKHRAWSQEMLAANANLTQGVISRAEDPDYGNLTVNTILKIAEGFDVAFIGKFVPFSELDKWIVDLSEKSMKILDFETEANTISDFETEANTIPAVAASAERPTLQTFYGSALGNPLENVLTLQALTTPKDDKVIHIEDWTKKKDKMQMLVGGEPQFPVQMGGVVYAACVSRPR